MNKKLNKRIIVAGVVALLFIWVCLAFKNMDWAELYAWILIGGGIMVVVAANIVVLAAKNGENEMFEPKITKEELRDLYRQNQAVVRLEDLQEVIGEKKRIVSVQDVSNVLEKMGFAINGVEDGFVYFKENDNQYRLFIQWIPTFQTNYLQLHTIYNVKSDEVDLFTRLAAEITADIKLVKMLVHKEEEGNSLCIAAETLHNGAEPLEDVIIPLIDLKERALERFIALREQTERDINDIEKQVNLHNGKTKYEC